MVKLKIGEEIGSRPVTYLGSAGLFEGANVRRDKPHSQIKFRFVFRPFLRKMKSPAFGDFPPCITFAA